MARKLLTALTLSLCTLLISAQLQPAFAQPRKQSVGYLNIVRQLIIVNRQTIIATGANANTNQPKVTPTAYAQPTIKPTNVPTKQPTNTIAPSPTKSIAYITPTLVPTKKVFHTPTIAPAPAENSGGDAMSFIMNEINAYRAKNGLSSVRTSAETCSFAAIRAAEVVTNFSHDGFQSRIDSKTLPYSSWTGITENIAMTSNYQEVVTMWENSPGHAANMRADTPFVCVRQSGSYFAYEGMKP